MRRRLESLRGTLTEDEKVIKEKLTRFDRDGIGRVRAEDLAAICAELGSRLSHRELENAILTLDVGEPDPANNPSGVSAIQAKPGFGRPL